MTVNDTKLNEGDALTAASINDRFTAFAGVGQGVNQLATDDIARKAIGPYHVQGLVSTGDLPNLSPGLAIEVATATTVDMSSAVYPVWTPITDGVTPAQITWDSTAGIPGDSSTITGFLVMFNIEVRHVYESPLRATDRRPEAAFGARIAIRDSGGSWAGVPRTHRFLSHTEIDQKNGTSAPIDDVFWPHHRDVSIKTLITIDDGSALSGIRAEMTYNEVKLALVNTPYAQFLRYNLSILPLFGAR